MPKKGEKVSPEKYLPGSKVPPVATVSPVVGLSEKLSCMNVNGFLTWIFNG